jgi:hypothetical protein
MKTTARRIRRLEDRFQSAGDAGLLLVMSSVTLELDSEDCVRILQECGYLAPSGPRFVDLLKIPDGLNADETERYLRKHGAELCTPQS